MLPTLNGAMAAFMNLYLEMVDMLLNSLHFLLVGLGGVSRNNPRISSILFKP